MDKINHFIIEYLNKLDLDNDSIKLFLSFIEKGSMTILQASRASNIERTKVYRLTEELLKKGLLEQVAANKKLIFKATNINNLEIIVNEKEANARYLKNSFLNFSQTLQGLSQTSSETKVLYYKGIEGIKQMYWNELEAKNEVVTYTYRVVDEILGLKFFRDWVYEFEERRKLKIREIRTDIFYKSLKEAKSKTVMKTNQIRYISPKILPINHELDIYNNVVAIFYWKDNEIFGIEIYNQQIADMQKNMFEVFWKIAKKDKMALKILEKESSFYK